uniref:Uncharacterized protein n=1 Tax=Vespula pensylvanica TaxID=30213 RepID=A0A834PDR8_VESPE|nr:hypothetical protein H0235_000294 [Vespula pensylvanica]
MFVWKYDRKKRFVDYGIFCSLTRPIVNHMVSLKRLSNGTMSLTKRIDEVRLLESRKSARLADQDTDFARLADMAGDRKRASSHSIDVPHVIGSSRVFGSLPHPSKLSYVGWDGCWGWLHTEEGIRCFEKGISHPSPLLVKG